MRLEVDTFKTTSHAAAHEGLHQLAFELNQANVSFILSTAQLPHGAKRTQGSVVSSQIIAALGTLSSILEITQELSLRVKEAIALSRVFYETCLIAAFISSDEGESAEKAELYSVYKAFRTQTQFREVLGVKFGIKRQPAIRRDDPRVRDALEVFGGSSNVRPCFVENREEMVQCIGQHDRTAALLFGGVEAMVHDFASEVIHGSYYGAQMFDFLANGPQDKARNIESHFEAVYFSVCLSIAALARSVTRLQSAEAPMASVASSAVELLLPHVPEDLREQLCGLSL
ncbi:hypothetical protein B6V73_15210 [Thioclava sp. JM3]|uniref:hypothetical protein n=1 Tax=Thioclava sp. JM3 TaxID=1973004 RepID=UPI000B53B8DE|nr:hypothetical protein [Thioclava sp. JM3]OWY15873.1 hypothetical protein B6V73_15210 [Thioclava sp. JM3]